MDKKRVFLSITLISLLMFLIIPLVSAIASIPTVLTALATHIRYTSGLYETYGLFLSEMIVTYSIQGTIQLVACSALVPAFFILLGLVFTFLSAKFKKLVIPGFIATGLALLSLVAVNGAVLFLTFGYDVVKIVYNSLYIGIQIGAYRHPFGSCSVSHCFHTLEDTYRYGTDFGINMGWCIVYIVFYSFFMFITIGLMLLPLLPFVLYVLSLIFIIPFKKKEKVAEEPAPEEQPAEEVQSLEMEVAL